MEIVKRRTAVVGLHWINDIVSATGVFASQYSAEVHRSGVVANTQLMLHAARAAGIPVVYTRVAFQPGHSDLVMNAPLYHAAKQLGALVDGTPGAEIIAELAPQPEDTVLVNSRVGGFVNSALDFTLRAVGVDTLILTGVATNATVESTARHASDLGYRTIVVSDCTCADSPESHEASLSGLALIVEIATAADVIAAMSAESAHIAASAS